MSTRFEREIREQPAALARLLASGSAAVEEAAAAVRAFAPRFVVTAARGSSDNAARYAKYLFGARNRLVVSLGAPSLVTLHGAPPALGEALVLGISQSGESPDIVALVEEGRRQGALTIALCNRPESPLARAAARVIDLCAGPEQAVAASKSYSAELLALAMLSTAMAGAGERSAAATGNDDRGGARRALGAIPDAVERTLALATPDALAAAAAAVGRAERLLVLGRGFHFATAFELALKIKETTGAMADPYATPDLFHGPLAMVGPGFPALVVAHTGAAFADAQAVLADLAARGAAVVPISDDPTLRTGPGGRERALLATAPGVPEWLSPITAIVPGQLLALTLALARGLDPDRPRGLSKVTRTR
ncbi:MAG TPA: SIS domain-containing protein [Polyangia bacterium]